MKKIFFLILLAMLLTACANHNPNLYKNYCQKDYWGDNNFDIFGRKSCVGDTGKWVDVNNGRDGYYCRTPDCSVTNNVTCKDTCPVK